MQRGRSYLQLGDTEAEGRVTPGRLRRRCDLARLAERPDLKNGINFGLDGTGEYGKFAPRCAPCRRHDDCHQVDLVDLGGPVRPHLYKLSRALLIPDWHFLVLGRNLIH